MKKYLGITAPVVIGAVLLAPQAFAATTGTVTVPVGFQVQTFAQGTNSQLKPDDITNLNGNIFVAYQNGVGSKGEASSTGVSTSTIVEYNQSGTMLSRWNVTGKVDGMTADPTNNRIIATVNEDGNSSLYTVTPGASSSNQVKHWEYVPDAEAKATLGGTDSIAIVNGKYYISASNPTPDSNNQNLFDHDALFQATFNSNGTVSLTTALMGNAKATDALTGKTVTLNLSDPDSSALVPSVSPKYAGDLMLDSQGDSELMFIHNMGPNQSVTRLSLGNAQEDDVAWATAKSGTLYVSDNGSNKVYAITGTFQPGVAFASLGSSVDTLNLSTGQLTPFIKGLSSSHGMLFVPSSTTTSTVKGATSPTTGLPMDEMLIVGAALLALGGSSFAVVRKRKK